MSTCWLSQGYHSTLGKILLSNYNPLLGTSALGTPNLVTMFFHMKFFTSTSPIFAKALGPLGKIVCHYHHISSVPLSLGERPDYIQHLLGKGPRTKDRVEISPQLVQDRCMYLALITSFNIVNHFSATRIPKSQLGVQVTYPLSGHHIFLREAQLTTWRFCWDKNTASMVLQMNVGTTSYLRIARNEPMFSIPSQLPRHPLTRTRRIKRLCMDPTNLAPSLTQPLLATAA